MLNKVFHTLTILLVIFAWVIPAYAQVADSTYIVTDTSITATDSLMATDTLSSDSIRTKGDIETTIKYSAEDSIRMDVAKKIVYLYGKAKIDYGAISLESDKIEINWENNTLTAYGGQDSTGKTIGIPVFKQGADMYTSEVIKYNFKSKKGLISKLITQQGEGYIHGERVKRQDNKMYVNHAQYTTCNLAHPHFYISANKLKLIPDDKIVSGPFNLVIGDVPTPLGFFLGMFPVPKKNKSGLIFPAYGEDRNKGFYLMGLGYYFAVSDYIGLKLITDVFSRGSYNVYMQGGYRKRYSYSGDLRIFFSTIKDNIDESANEIRSYNLSWTHSTDGAGRTSGLSASVNVGSSAFYKINSYNPASRNANDFNSTINYRKTFVNSPFSLNVSARQSQNVNTRKMNIMLPDLVFTMNRIFPFRKKNSLGKSWYEQLSVSYNFQTRLTVTNTYQNFNPQLRTYQEAEKGIIISDVNQINYLFRGNVDGLVNLYQRNDSLYTQRDTSKKEDQNKTPIRFNGAQYGAMHTIPIQTSIKILKKFSLNPSLNFTEYWYPNHLQYRLGKSYDSRRDSIYVSQVNEFSRAWGWSTSGTSLRTNVYGTLNFKKGKLIGLRHIVTPSVGYSYSPNLSLPGYGSYAQIRDEAGNIIYQNDEPLIQSRFGNTAIYGVPSGRESSIISFSINNVLEAKVRNEKDTVKPTKKIKLLDNLSIDGSYNLIAKRFKLSNINITGRTNINEGKINIAFGGLFDPYYYSPDTTKKDAFKRPTYIRMDTFSINNGGPLLNFVNGFITVNTSLNPKARKKDDQEKKVSKEDQDYYNYIKNNPEQYLDFNIPWNIAISYQLYFNGPKFHPFTKGPIATHSATINGDLSLTKNLKITFYTTYNFVYKTLPSSTMGIVRDLHCWQMAINLSKFSDNYIYSFNINAKASLLQDLKLTKRSTSLNNSVSF